MIKGQAALFVAFCAVLLTSCDGEETGSVMAKPTDALAWSQINRSVSEQTWEGVESLSCEMTSGSICGPDGCKTVKPVTNVRWHPGTKQYQRCGGGSPCDDYTAQVAYSGSWANIAVPDRALMARLTGSGEFMEVLTQMDTAYVYYGLCRPMQ